MNWLLALLNLIPIIANGIQTLHADKTLGDKSQMATDSLNLAIAGAQAGLPASDAAIVTAIAPLAQSTLSTTLTALHNAGSALAPPIVVSQPQQAAA